MIGILEKKSHRLKFVTSGVIIIMVLSFVSVLSSVQSADITVQRDVLIVNLGAEKAPLKTSAIIENFLNEITEGLTNSRNSDVDFGLETNHMISKSVHCTQSIQKEMSRPILKISMVQSDVSSFENDVSHYRASIVIIVGHGSEYGIAEISDSDSLSWSDVIETTKSAKPQLTILASCFSSNAISLGQNIIGFNGVVDAILVGHIVSLLLAQVIPDTPSLLIEDTLYSVLHRSEVILHDGSNLMPLSIQSDWASIRVPVVAILTGVFFIAGYQTIWAVQGGLASVAAAILIGATGVVIGGLFQVAIELIRGTIGVMLQAINYDIGRIFNATIGAILGFIISYSTPFLLPSFVSALAYAITGTTAALALANTPVPWVRAAACTSAAIGIISIFDMFVQFL